MDDTRRQLAAAIRDLTRDRGPTGSICPSEAARAVGGDTWRELMGQAREVARELARAGDIEVTQRGRILDPDDAWRGPIRLRIRRPEPDRTAAARGTCR